MGRSLYTRVGYGFKLIDGEDETCVESAKLEKFMEESGGEFDLDELYRETMGGPEYDSGSDAYFKWTRENKPPAELEYSGVGDYLDKWLFVKGSVTEGYYEEVPLSDTYSEPEGTKEFLEFIERSLGIKPELKWVATSCFW